MINKYTDSIGDRIDKLLKQKHLSKKELAKKLNISSNTITYWTKNQRIPTTEQLISLAETLEVSTDYILGLQPVPTINMDLASVCKYLNINEVSVNEIKKLTKESLYRKVIEDFTDNKSVLSDTTYTRTSKLHELLHLILEMDFNLFCQMDSANKIKKELSIDDVELLNYQNPNYQMFWESDEKVIVNLFQIQEKVKEFVKDFEKEKIQKIDNFKKIIPSTKPTIYTTFEREEIKNNSDNGYFVDYMEMNNQMENNEEDKQNENNVDSEV